MVKPAHEIQAALTRAGRPDLARALSPKRQLNKQDPGSLLGRVVWLLEREGLDDAAKVVRQVSTVVQRAWQRKD